MRYLIALLLPPLGMLSVGKAVQAVVCVVLMVTLIGWPIASIWALMVVLDAKQEARARRLERAAAR